MSLIVCHECGTQYDDQAAYCPGCGIPSHTQLKCPECGAVISGTEAFCRFCGAPVENTAQPITVPMPGTAAEIFPASSVPTPVPTTAQNDTAPVLIPAPAKQSSRPSFFIMNVYALLAMIPITAAMFGKIFTINIGNIGFSFGIADFSDFTAKIVEVIGVLGTSEELKSVTTILSVLKYVFYASVIISAIVFITGWFRLGKGKPLSSALSLPITYTVFSLLLVISINCFAFSSINDILSKLGNFKIVMWFSTNFSPILAFLVIALLLRSKAAYDISHNNSGIK